MNERFPSTITSGQAFSKGQGLLSSDERYKLIFQGDGNLVLYSPNRATWASRTVGAGGDRVVLQSDGNLVMYTAAGKPVWHTRTNGRGLSTLRLQSDGNLVIYDANNRPTWHTRTNGVI